MAGQHHYAPGALLTVDDATDAVGAQSGRTAARPCPIHTSCDGCGGQIREGWPVRATNGPGLTAWMHPPCWWERTP